ncbi:DUF5996 family protein [Sphingomonas sp. URHD0057]|uniref:DUF5996 family protein n=1 Tax=Sphingomonas sp. URHD0057 TaxID=1380389 RepID=UPI00048C316B|nr:DUF5996 family protein [Sphingomonas sp. URHD0057]
MTDWPELDPARDGDTFAVLHLASQMLGKIRLAHATWQNHGWHLTLRPRANGLAILPAPASPGRSFALTLDLCAHGIALAVSDGGRDLVPFAGQTIADIHAGLIAMLDKHELPSAFNGRPNEIADAVRFADDRAERRYDADSARRLLTALQLVVPIFDRFRAGFLGKASPVHFFWGSFDLAVTRFSGRRAPEHPGGIPGLPDRITREAYSHEVSSAGFWPGGVTAVDPIFYSYAYPEPDGFRTSTIAGGSFDETLGEFTLRYADVRSAPDPPAMLTGFLQSTYDAAADLAHWDRAALEREPVAP